ncbi:hypothetical protein BGZ58_004899 [Dissophora ornata]|nr:hypothetical protein BGZ58_004899 [Dissophora ornata]
MKLQCLTVASLALLQVVQGAWHGNNCAVVLGTGSSCLEFGDIAVITGATMTEHFGEPRTCHVDGGEHLDERLLDCHTYTDPITKITYFVKMSENSDRALSSHENNDDKAKYIKEHAEFIHVPGEEVKEVNEIRFRQQ